MSRFSLFFLCFFSFLISVFSFFNIIYSYYFDLLFVINKYFFTLIISLILSFIFLLKKNVDEKISIYENITTVILGYFLLPIILSIPYYFGINNISFIDSYFESISGFTSTGFSIFENIKHIDKTLILWRSSTQWIGGLYFLFFLIIIFSNKQFKFKLNDLTYSGGGGIISETNVKNLLIRILIFYSMLSLIIFFMLNISGVRMFNSLNLSMSLISAGGFIPTDSLDKIIKSNFQKIIFVISLLISILNFFLVTNILQKRILIKEHKEDFFLIIIAIILTLLIFFNGYDLLDIIISVLSSLGNSGLSTIRVDNNLSLYFILITIIGGSLVSNTSGIKLIRIYNNWRLFN